MVIGIGTSLLALGLAGPTGLAFGFGYGYGVRQGYSAFKPHPSQQANTLKQNLNPITGGLGMGLQSGQEITAKKMGLGRPNLQSQESTISDTKLSNIQRMSKFKAGGYQFDRRAFKKRIR